MMFACQQSKQPLVGFFPLALVLLFSACTRGPVTGEQACQIAAQHLFSLGQDTSRSTEYLRPDHPISLDTLKAGNGYIPGPWDEDLPYLKAAHGRLNGKVFWLCHSVVRRPATGGPNLVTDNVGSLYGEVFIDAGTGEVLLTFPQDYYQSTGSSH